MRSAKHLVLALTLVLSPALALSAGCGGDSEGGGSDSGGSAGSAGSGGTAGNAGNGGSAGGGAGGSAGTGGGGGDYRACSVPADCVVVPESCCGSCGVASRGDAIAVNVDQQNTYRGDTCGEEPCPACAAPIDPTLVATCTSGQCEVVDIYEEPFTECSSNEDCRLRSRDCCECGGALDREGLIAVAVGTAGYEDVVCEEQQGCPECAPDYESIPAEALCSQGHCQVAWADEPF